MANVIRGTKRRCPHCGAPFYDLNRHPIVCPKCDQEVKPEALPKIPLRSGRSGTTRNVVPKPVEEVEDVRAFDEDEVLVTADEVEDEEEDLVGGEARDEDEDEIRE